MSKNVLVAMMISLALVAGCSDDDNPTAAAAVGATVVVSVEPFPDDSPLPFTLKPLVKQIPTGTAAGAVVTMDNQASTLPTGTATITGTTLRLTFTGLEPLLNGYYYEGWAIIGSPAPTGHFNVNSSGQLITHPEGVVLPNGDFQTGIANLASATDIVITVEPINDPDPAPAATHILAGSVLNLAANLSVTHAAALGNSFTAATGKFILAAPTTTATTDDKSGVWFLDASSGTAVAGLSLPTLPTGWKYEGWVVIKNSSGVDTPFTTGTFTSALAADSNASAPPYSPAGGPPFPGEDFLQNAPAGFTFPTNLAGS